MRELKSGGETEAADHLKQARKPTVPAWAANQLARSERMNVRALLTAGEQLRDAQAQLMRGGKPEGLRRAQESGRRALAALLEAGREVVEGDANLRKLEATLRASAVDPDGRVLLERGRLTKELAPSGFGFEGMPKPTRRKPRATGAKKQPDAQAERQRAQIAEARAKLQEARKRARAAEREAEKARKEAGQIEEQMRELERSKR